VSDSCCSAAGCHRPLSSLILTKSGRVLMYFVVAEPFPSSKRTSYERRGRRLATSAFLQSDFSLKFTRTVSPFDRQGLTFFLRRGCSSGLSLFRRRQRGTGSGRRCCIEKFVGGRQPSASPAAELRRRRTELLRRRFPPLQQGEERISVCHVCFDHDSFAVLTAFSTRL